MPKKSWKDWAVDYINQTGKCPGEGTSMVSDGDMLTEQEFKLTLMSCNLHDWKNCHYKDFVTRPPTPPDAKEVKISKPIGLIDIEELKNNTNIDTIKRAAALKKNIKIFADHIKVVDGDHVKIPRELLHLATYIENFFSEE